MTNPLEAAGADFDRTEIYWSKAPAPAPDFDGTAVNNGTLVPDSDSGIPGTFKKRGSQVVVFDSETDAAPVLPSLAAGATYNFLAVSYDRCGNISRIRSGGRHPPRHPRRVATLRRGHPRPPREER